MEEEVSGREFHRINQTLLMYANCKSIKSSRIALTKPNSHFIYLFFFLFFSRYSIFSLSLTSFFIKKKIILLTSLKTQIQIVQNTVLG